MTMLNLPPALEQAIRQALATTTPARWQREAQALSLRYRAERSGDEPALVVGAAQALGYAALVMPATYAQLYGALAATAARVPAWQPQTLLDLGSGPGTALWAAAEQWPSLIALTAWEREPALLTLGQTLAGASASPAVRGARWQRMDATQLPGAAPQFDVVVLGHVLNELPVPAQRAVVAWAWQHTAGVLLIVEPGHRAGFAVVRAARDQLIGAAHTLAPCAHDQPCPLADDWCHFPQRLARPDFQRQARGAPSMWEDAKFSYAALARFPVAAPIWGRVIRESTSNKAYAETTVSTAAGVRRYRGLKRHRDTFRLVKDLAWGAALETPLPEPIAALNDGHTLEQP